MKNNWTETITNSDLSSASLLFLGLSPYAVALCAMQQSYNVFKYEWLNSGLALIKIITDKMPIITNSLAISVTLLIFKCFFTHSILTYEE